METIMSEHVLVEAAATKRLGRPIYFAGMTGIGPRCTKDFSEAHRFPSFEDAVCSRACQHTLSYFEAREADDAEAYAKRIVAGAST